MALATVTVGVVLAGTVAFAAGLWWVGGVAAVVARIPTAAADRSRVGEWR